MQKKGEDQGLKTCDLYIKEGNLQWLVLLLEKGGGTFLGLANHFGVSGLVYSLVVKEDSKTLFVYVLIVDISL